MSETKLHHSETRADENLSPCCSSSHDSCLCNAETGDAEAGEAHKMTRRSDEAKKKLINRLSRIEGQIRGIKGMVERDSYCPDILNQCAAATSALNAFCRDLIGAHIRGCVAHDLKEGDDSVIEELVETLQKLMK